MSHLPKYDVIIVGAGPAGTASALYLLQAGLKPLILEKEAFPRYHIGESLTGECGKCLRELGLERRMNEARFPIKHGVQVYGAHGKHNFWVPVQKRDLNHQLQPSSTWQVRRSTFDNMLLKTAIERGAELVLGEAITPLIEGNRIKGIRFRTPQGKVQALKSEVLIDASGPATFLAHKSGLTSQKERGRYDKQVVIFSQVVGAVRAPGEAAGNTLIFYRQKHHWAWFIPIDDERVSVGVVVPSDYFKAQKCSKEDFLRQELQTLNPELSKRLPTLAFVEPVRSASNYSYHIKQFTGQGFLCVGDSHRFVDPIFSFGVNFAVKEAQFAAQAIKEYLGGKNALVGNPLAAYQALAEQGQDVIQDMIDCFWTSPLAFFLIQNEYRADMIDLFAGRIYGPQMAQVKGLQAIRRLLATKPALTKEGKK